MWTDGSVHVVLMTSFRSHVEMWPHFKHHTTSCHSRWSFDYFHSWYWHCSDKVGLVLSDWISIIRKCLNNGLKFQSLQYDFKSKHSLFITKLAGLNYINPYSNKQWPCSLRCLSHYSSRRVLLPMVSEHILQYDFKLYLQPLRWISLKVWLMQPPGSLSQMCGNRLWGLNE